MSDPLPPEIAEMKAAAEECRRFHDEYLYIETVSPDRVLALIAAYEKAERESRKHQSTVGKLRHELKQLRRQIHDVKRGGRLA